MKVTGLLLAAMLLSGLAAPRADAYVWTKRFALEGRVDLRVVTDLAPVRLQTWSRPEVDVRVVTTGWKFGREGLRVAASQDSDRVRVEVLLPPWGFDPSWTRRSIDVVIRLPDSARIDIATDEGDVTLPPMRGDFRVRTWDGHISAERLAGRIELRSGEGSIRAQEVDGALEVHSDGGQLAVDGRFDRLNMKSEAGDVFVHLSRGSRPASDWSLETASGRLWLKIPRDLDATLDARVERGRIEFVGREGIVVPEDPTRLVRPLGRGGPNLRLWSDRGRIIVEER